MVFLPWLQQTQHWEQKSRSPGSLLLGTNPSRQDAFSSLVIISSPILPPGVTLKTVYSAPVLMSVPQKKRCWINTEVLSGSSAYTDQALRQLNMCPYSMSTHRDLMSRKPGFSRRKNQSWLVLYTRLMMKDGALLFDLKVLFLQKMEIKW